MHGRPGKQGEDDEIVADMLHVVLSLMEEKNKLRRDLAALGEYLAQRDHQNKAVAQQLRVIRDENTRIKEKIMRKQREREQEEEDDQGDSQEERSNSLSLIWPHSGRGTKEERV